MKCISSYCDRAPVARGLCSKHHRRFMKGEDFNKKTILELTAKERLLKRVNKTKDGCWFWGGATRGNKPFMYGIIWIKRKAYSTHRLSWMIHNGKIPTTEGIRSICVCHKCDNPLCVNPEHLYLGTHKQNMQDKAVKNRYLNRNKKSCKRGHEYTVKNTYVSKQGLRHCRECHRLKEIQRRTQLCSGGDLFLS